MTGSTITASTWPFRSHFSCGFSADKRGMLAEADANQFGNVKTGG
jgi:hypothetical protein